MPYKMRGRSSGIANGNLKERNVKSEMIGDKSSLFACVVPHDLCLKEKTHLIYLPSFRINGLRGGGLDCLDIC